MDVPTSRRVDRTASAVLQVVVVVMVVVEAELEVVEGAVPL